jgi:hypothetical protein
MPISLFPKTVSNWAAVLVAAAAFAPQVLAGPVEMLPGRWTGWGKMTLDGGNTERVKCVATYFREKGGSELRHNLRCASTNYRIDAVAQLKVSDGRVSGEWQERSYVTGGAVSGRVKGDGIAVRIVGDQFTASMIVDTGPCAQSMDIAPTGMGVRRIAVELKKC